MLNKICYLLVKDDKNRTNIAVTGLKTWTFLISLITELPVDSGSKLPTARSACYNDQDTTTHTISSLALKEKYSIQCLRKLFSNA